MRTTKFFLVAIAVTFPFAAGGQQKPSQSDQESKITLKVIPSIPSCVDWTNLGTTNPKLVNRCSDSHTIGVTNFSAGRPVKDRVFHLNSGEERPVQFPGDLMVIQWVKDWVSDGPDDGSPLLLISNHKDGDMVVWEVRNASPDRFNAFQATVYRSGKRDGVAYYAIPPGQTRTIVAMPKLDTGAVILDWSRLDPP